MRLPDCARREFEDEGADLADVDSGDAVVVVGDEDEFADNDDDGGTDADADE